MIFVRAKSNFKLINGNKPTLAVVDSSTKKCLSFLFWFFFVAFYKVLHLLIWFTFYSSHLKGISETKFYIKSSLSKTKIRQCNSRNPVVWGLLHQEQWKLWISVTGWIWYSIQSFVRVYNWAFLNPWSLFVWLAIYFPYTFLPCIPLTTCHFMIFEIN